MTKPLSRRRRAHDVDDRVGGNFAREFIAEIQSDPSS
jgi:hypothetical protein